MTSDEGRPEPADERIATALSHDVRGALRGVTGFLGLIDRDLESLPDEVQQYLDTARRSALTADLMLERLVHWLRLEHRTVRLEAVELAPLVTLAVSESIERAPGEAPHLDVQASVVVRGEPDLLVECLAELVTNARTFGGGAVAVRVRAEVDAGRVVVDVSDDGPGIPDDLVEQAFGLFRLLQPRGRFPGVGMGLPIARRLAEVQGGTLEVVAGVARGTTVRLRLAAGASPR